MPGEKPQGKKAAGGLRASRLLLPRVRELSQGLGQSFSFPGWLRSVSRLRALAAGVSAPSEDGKPELSSQRCIFLAESPNQPLSIINLVLRPPAGLFLGCLQ